MLEIRLLGQFELRRDSQPVELASRAAQSLLAYLLLNTEVPHRREKLAGVLWPDVPEENARGNLRHALYAIRKALEGGSAGARYLLADDLAIAFDGRSDCWLDVSRLKQKVDEGWSAVELIELVSVYRGELLPGFYDEWVLLEREYLHTLFERKMEVLLDRLVEEQRWQDVVDWGERWLRLGHAPEPAYRALMVAHAGLGDTASLGEAYQRCTDELRRYLDAEPSPQTQALYKRLLKGPPAEGLPLVPLHLLAGPPSAAHAPFQAPAQISYFVGRRDLMGMLLSQITQGGYSTAVALCGLGGIGKTTLAVHLAHNLRAQLPDGVLWASAASSDPLAILDSWARAYGRDFTSLPDLQSRAAAVRDLLADKQVLVVLDDVTDPHTARQLLLGGERNAVLLTTRNVEAAAALGARVVLLPVLIPAESRLLLVHILGEERVAAEEEPAAEIAELLKHHPLALAIAANRLLSRPRWPLANLAERLRDEKQRLGELQIGDLEVRASFQISWRALDEAHQRTFALLGAFEGRPFTGSALAAVAGLDRDLAGDHLARLVALSCLGEEGAAHYRQHPLLADFARERLGEAPEAHARMAQYYLEYAARRRGRYADLEREWDNLTVSMRAAHQRELWKIVADFAEVLTDAWFTLGRFTEARQGYQWACEAAGRLERPPLLAANLYQWGRACIEQDDYEEAERHLAQCLQIRRELGDEAGQAEALQLLGRIEIERTNFPQAERWLADSRRLHERLGDRRGVAETLSKQARIQYRGSNYVAAVALLQQALEIHQDIGDLQGCVRTLAQMANGYYMLDFQASPEPASSEARQDLLGQARDCCQRALELCEELQDQTELVSVLETLSAVCRRQGDLVAARQYVERGLALLRSMGDRKFQAMCLYDLSKIEADLENYPAALQAAQQSLDLCQQAHDVWGSVFVLRQLGEVLSRQGQPEAARPHWQQALEIAGSFSSEHPLIKILRERLGASAAET